MADKKETKTPVADDIVVEDIAEVAPVELPLIIKPPKGGWKNEMQAEYAKVLNGYAYTNREKWEAKKDKLIEKLKACGSNPELCRAAMDLPLTEDVPKFKIKPQGRELPE